MKGAVSSVSVGDITTLSTETSEDNTELFALIEQQNLLIQEQTTSIDNGVVIMCIGIGLIFGAIVALGLWKGLK